MKELIREAALGQIIRFVSRNRLLKYPEEVEGFQIPFERMKHEEKLARINEDADSDKQEEVTPATEEYENIDHVLTQEDKGDDFDIEKSGTQGSPAGLDKVQSVKSLSRTQTIPFTRERFEVDQQLAAERTLSLPIQPVITSTGQVLVTWYTTDDQDNPQNWSQKKKSWVSFLIWIYTFAVYASSAIYVSSELGIMEHFGVQEFKASLGLALFVLGYGIGPLIFSPMSEIPIIGRNVPYIVTFALFVILSVPTALVDDLGGLLFLRFLQGFFGSPCLATGPATMQDIYSMLYVPIAVAFWVSAGFSAPAVGPLLSGFAVMAKGWRWSLWEILWMSGPVFILWFISMPETLEDNILLRRAKRLRKLTGNDKYVSQSELNQKNMTAAQIAKNAFVKPVEINIKDPAILFTSIYSGIIYGTYYSFFEVFPLVYGGIYHFNIGEIGLVFICIAIGAAIGMLLYDLLIIKVVIPEILKNGMGPQEGVLKPALIFVFGPTLSLFLFAWTSRESIHWMAPTVFLTIYPISVFIVFQAIFAYIPLSYPQYAASLFAGNDFVRSFFAFGSVMFSRSMYINLGIGKGVSLLGGLSVLGWIGMYYLYFNGAKLRARSKFAVSGDEK
ncbi:putative caffeine resistance protein 5 [Venturia nashicola]|uniref:Putative caffeine resistance protein 5 n=1 Tax=Venturia nashicola TaxID=86259 RepID=A0A4Z1NG19_9PEZI|nr:putative caffeine resistance protein 5 [Venturia nashicola]TLD20180.1 putative caffeine resistance protein 5 [Venturia nashicola]